MKKMESVSEAHDSPNIRKERKEQRDFLASFLLDAVNDSLWENNSGKRHTEIKWDKVDKARKCLLKDPIAHLYFILLDINIDTALGMLQEKWHRMDVMHRPFHISRISHTEQRVFH